MEDAFLTTRPNRNLWSFVNKPAVAPNKNRTEFICLVISRLYVALTWRTFHKLLATVKKTGR